MFWEIFQIRNKKTEDFLLQRHKNFNFCRRRLRSGLFCFVIQMPVHIAAITLRNGRIILRGIFRKWEGIVGTGWSGLRIGTGGGHL
jgi:hypothetical protein